MNNSGGSTNKKSSTKKYNGKFNDKQNDSLELLKYDDVTSKSIESNSKNNSNQKNKKDKNNTQNQRESLNDVINKYSNKTKHDSQADNS